jgi:HSP20 family protein
MSSPSPARPVTASSSERYFGHFSRAIPLPSEIDVEKAEAKFDKGVLTVRFPKTREVSGGRRISLQ